MMFYYVIVLLLSCMFILSYYLRTTEYFSKFYRPNTTQLPTLTEKEYQHKLKKSNKAGKKRLIAQYGTTPSWSDTISLTTHPKCAATVWVKPTKYKFVYYTYKYKSSDNIPIILPIGIYDTTSYHESYDRLKGHGLNLLSPLPSILTPSDYKLMMANDVFKTRQLSDQYHASNTVPDVTKVVDFYNHMVKSIDCHEYYELKDISQMGMIKYISPRGYFIPRIIFKDDPYFTQLPASVSALYNHNTTKSSHVINLPQDITYYGEQRVQLTNCFSDCNTDNPRFHFQYLYNKMGYAWKNELGVIPPYI